MRQEEVRVGVVGAHSKAGWAKLSHIPAIKALAGVRLAAVATRNPLSARESAESFGADRWFSDPLAMIGDDGIDLVTVCVKVPGHRELVLAALQAGKAVYCEAPLGLNVSETEEMARAARAHHTAIGLQGRLNPAVRRAAELVSSNKIGRPLSAQAFASVPAYGPAVPSSYAVYDEASFGANLLPVTAGHTLDIIETILGPISEVDARSVIRWPTVKLTDTGGEITRETPDQVDVLGLTRSGSAFTAHIGGGATADDARFALHIRGSDGWLSLASRHPYGVQAGEIELTSNVAFASPEPAKVSGGFVGAAINVGEVYAHLVRDMKDGTYTTPGFKHALHNARLIAAVRRAGEHGERQKVI